MVDIDTSFVRLDLEAYCHDCRRWHRMGTTPQGFLAEAWEWEAKHRGHRIEFLSPKRRIKKGFDDTLLQGSEPPWWLQYQENTNINIAYAASAAMITADTDLDGLASSSTFLAGRETNSVDNTSNRYIDYRIGIKIQVSGTVNPTDGTEIRIYGYAVLDDTPTYPLAISGSSAALTVANVNQLDSTFVLFGATTVTTTQSIYYVPKCLTVAEAFGHAPLRWGLYVTHNTGTALHATTSGSIRQTGIYYIL